MYELALRHSVGKCVILISEWGSLPFDVGWIRTIQFVRSDFGFIEGRKKLEAAIAAALQDGCDRVTATRILQGEATPGSVAQPRPPEPAKRPRPPTMEELQNALEDVSEEPPGFLDILAEAEGAMPRVTGIVEEMTGVLGQITTIAATGTEEIKAADESGGPVAAKRLAIVHKVAQALEQATELTEDLVGRYRQEMSSVNKGISYLLDRLEAEPALMSEAGEFPQMLLQLAEVTRTSLASSASFADSVAQMGNIARVLRNPTRRIADGWRAFANLSAPIFEWADRISKILDAQSLPKAES
jgi:hypothetical protein